MSIGFSCYHSKSNRLYIGLNQEPDDIRQIVISQQGKRREKKGLGMREYGCVWGRVLTCFGFAFKTKDHQGKNLYINKKSFCNLLDRLRQHNLENAGFNPDFVQAQYCAKKDKAAKARIKNIRGVFKKSLPEFAKRNISEISLSMLGQIELG